ncbi:MAG: cyclic nucleotide-binding domain-containing protein [Desulfosarcinaceae bacterium]
MALNAIIQVNEAIENEKSKALGPGRRELWHKFFNELSTEEVNAFFMSLKNVVVEPDDVILEQGKPNEQLFLINSGRLKIVYNNGDRQLLIHQLDSGDIFGDETFFSVNVCTTSVVALSSCRLSYFDRSDLEKLGKKLPLLGANLEKICSSNTRIADRIRQRGIERRAHRRINLQAKVRVQTLTPNATNTLQRAFSAELWDISKNGLSFYLQSKNRETVRKLIGRTLGVAILLKTGATRKEISLTGMVHGVQGHPLDEYSVHLKLNREISDNDLKKLSFLASRI